MKKLIPERRKHACDICHKDKPTEVFLGYNFDVLWICGDCYKRITEGIRKKHKVDIFSTREYV